MAAITVNNLPDAALPVLGTDKTIVTRDGTNVNDVTVDNLTALRKVTVQDEGTSLTTQVALINFTGAGVTATNTGDNVTVNIPGGSGGGSLTNFTEGRNTAAPNATVPVHFLEATGAETNIDVAIVPKGTGAFSLDVADNAITGGNKRGANAVDLQTSRTAATQVASGSGSFVAGQNNTASGSNAIAIGRNATASGADSCAIGVGNGASATATNAVAIGSDCSATGGQATNLNARQSNASGAFSLVAASLTATASGYASAVFANPSFFAGQSISASASQAASVAIGAGANSATGGQVAFGHLSDSIGRYQTTLTGLRQVTTGTASTRATADGASGATANQLTLRNNSVFKFMGRVVAYDLTTLDAKEWEFSGLIKRGANAAATSLVGTPSVTSQFADTNAAAWMVAVSADTTNGALAVTVTGAGANQIRWYVEVFAYETGV